MPPLLALALLAAGAGAAPGCAPGTRPVPPGAPGSSAPAPVPPGARPAGVMPAPGALPGTATPAFPGGAAWRPGAVWPVPAPGALRVEELQYNPDPVPHFTGTVRNPARREARARVAIPLFNGYQRPLGLARSRRPVRVPARGTARFAVVPLRPFIFYGAPVCTAAPAARPRRRSGRRSGRRAESLGR